MPEPLGPPFLLILNLAAGGGRSKATIRRATAALDALRYPFRLETSTSAEHASDLAREALKMGELPVAVGGDGQVARVAMALVGTGQPMGVIPCGRGNDLARGLGIPTDPVAAVDALVDRDTVTIDVGSANGMTFLGIASVGFDSRANEIANRSSFLPGRTVYAWSAIRALFGWRSVRFSLSYDGTSERVDAHTIAVANNCFYGGGMKVAPDAELTDGLLDLVVVGGVSRFRFIADFPKVFAGRHVDGTNVTETKVREVVVDSAERFVLYADGDPLTELPATIRVIPGSLRIVVPGGGPR